jgi:hypothetical protein
MQKEQSGAPKDPKLFDAEKLYLWVLGEESDSDHVIALRPGPRLHIIGQAPPVSGSPIFRRRLSLRLSDDQSDSVVLNLDLSLNLLLVAGGLFCRNTGSWAAEPCW